MRVADHSTDRLRECYSDKGGGVQNPKKFVDVINEISFTLHLIANCRTLVHGLKGYRPPVFIEVDDEMSVSARRFGTI